MKRLLFLILALTLTAAACGDDDTSTPGGATEGTPATEAPETAVTTTTVAPAATDAPTTSAAPAALFAPEDLSEAVLQDGDPWSVPAQGVVPIELSIDDIWPLEGDRQFPDERAIYEGAGFVAGSFAFFVEPADGLVLTGAHLFDDATGANAALDVIQGSFSDVELVAAITGLPAGALNEFELFDPGNLGDQAVGVRLTGATDQVIGVVWVTGNLLQFVRAAMPLGDTDREAAANAVAAAMAARTG